MPTYNVGYNAAGAALDYTTIASAIVGAAGGDTLSLNYGDANKGTNFGPVNQDCNKSLTFSGALGNQRVSIGENNTFPFWQTTAGVALSFVNLSLGGGSNRQFLRSDSDTLFVFDRCRFVGTHIYPVLVSASATSSTYTFNHCEFFGCMYTLGINTTSCTVEFNNCAVMWFGVFGIDNSIGCTMSAYNTVVVGGNVASGSCFTGTISGSNNASDDGTAPGAGAVDLRVATTYMLMHGNTDGVSAYSARPWSASCPLVNAGTDRGLTLDIDNQAINQSTSAYIGPYGSTLNLAVACAPPTTPTISAVDDGDGANSTITVSGSDAGTTNDLYQWQQGTGWVQSSLTSGGSNNATRSGDGTIQIAMTPGVYFLRVDSIDADGNQAVSNVLAHTQASSTNLHPEEALWKLLADSAAVGAICGDRIYPELVPESAPTPFIVFSRTGNDHHSHLLADSGLASSTFDVNMVADTQSAMRDLERAVRLALSGYRGTVTNTNTLVIRRIWLESEASEFVEPETGQSRGVHVASHTYTIHYKENVTTF